jgi:hypothetical protein
MIDWLCQSSAFSTKKLTHKMSFQPCSKFSAGHPPPQIVAAEIWNAYF